MRDLLIGVGAAAVLAIISPVSAQLPPPTSPAAVAAYPAPRYPFPSTTPEDAYRAGLINRWQLEQYQGPTPQALQGPSVNGGSKGGSGGGGM
jgi:hypothetical protein